MRFALAAPRRRKLGASQMDKRLWSGAILVLTIVVAGASSLPTLLLRPATPDAPPVAPELPTAQVPQPLPVVATVEPTPAPKPIEAAPPPAPEVARSEVAQPAPSQAAAPTPVEAAPAGAPAAATAAVAAATPVAFPPVQPIGVATQAGPDVAPQQPAPTQSRAASATPDGTKARTDKSARAPRMTLQDAKKRKRSVRPAIFPLREFFAWRR
jgi:hypothetical protein